MHFANATRQQNYAFSGRNREGSRNHQKLEATFLRKVWVQCAYLKKY